MEPIDYEHTQQLQELEGLIEEVTNDLNHWITEEANTEIILIEELDKYPEIKDTLSLKNKFIKLRTLSDNPEVKKWVVEWVHADAEIRVHRHKLKQVEGKRDSLKKIFSITPR